MQYTLKKSLGQHFLIDKTVCEKIRAVLMEQPINQLVEVGPGAGALTEFIYKIPTNAYKAIELDTEKVNYLLHAYPDLAGKLINEDFLETAIPFEGSFVLVGNFPYNISTQIVFKVLDWKEQVPMMVGMFQKEVAERIAAKSHSKAYGILSVLVQAFYEVTYLFDVPPSAFNPPPKVDSGVIMFKRKAIFPAMASEKSFYHIVKMAFGQRRKMLRNPLKPYFTSAQLEDPIFTKRAENLTFEDYAALTFKMHNP
ncbi:MAG: 16S rRNA (adenine(1518)-N(6)/adenine(1519)-N(6))-dimethyltransferase RsmA [Sediminibacterium sp.]|jgi:16S rRNA (adenine1518-N6/adenine1519-N6)-dimethyltransferase|nr:16S rRNA (adenine(1518)-N(6)/adenine(1519)-N(6))-dimethyltransferase RsmA [Sediminibacterium sp.]